MDHKEILEKLVYDLIWSWDHRTDQIWFELDPELWALTHNPLVILQTVSRQKLEETLANPYYQQLIDDLGQAMHAAEVNEKSWFRQKYPKSPVTLIAYFSMEFMLSESLPIYSGGLGHVAGDTMKAMNDLGIPVVGIGLLYQQGYFRQVIDQEGAQQAFFPYNSPGQLPIQPTRLPNGEWLRLEILLPGRKLWLRVWEVKIGRIKLYLLDSNDLANYPPDRSITGELYGGSRETRLEQEIALGLGGGKLLEALHLKPEVYHLNEGHAAFAILERCRQYQENNGVSFSEALAATRAGNLFTTHTAVSAGFDRFDPKLLENYLGHYVQDNLHIPFSEFLALGRASPNDPEEPFNMAYLAIHGSGAVNAVSKLHEEVSRNLFSPLFPRWPISEIPIGHVTNGIHVRSWDSSISDDLWTETCGKERWMRDAEEMAEQIRAVPDEKIWQMREKAREQMISFGRFRLTQMLKARCASPEEIEEVKHRFKPRVFTIGFARRFATYKRPNLLLRNLERLERILTNKERPAQLLIAGKAHPADLEGQRLIQEWIAFIKRKEICNSIVFLQDYDMLMTERLVGGVDLWINTPRRPWEACGTSGMKILVNGGLNLSVLDGWWSEAFRPEVGWAIGDRSICSEKEIAARDAKDAEELYNLLEHTIIPEFYKRDAIGIPREWVAKVRESMASLTWSFSTNRSLTEYMDRYYVPAAKAYRERVQDQGFVASEIATWTHAWSEAAIQMRGVEVTSDKEQHHFRALIDLGGLPPEAASVELFASAAKPVSMRATALGEYTADVSKERPASDYTVRVIPRFSGSSVPLENPVILWQK